MKPNASLSPPLFESVLLWTDWLPNRNPVVAVLVVEVAVLVVEVALLVVVVEGAVEVTVLVVVVLVALEVELDVALDVVLVVTGAVTTTESMTVFVSPSESVTVRPTYAVPAFANV